MNHRVLKLTALSGVYVSLSSPAMAYLDGATASILLQALIGAFATWLMYSRIFVAKVKSFFRTAKKSASTPDAE